MATYYWVGGDGNWSDATNHWSNASGGTPNASYLPTSADNVIFDANSNTGTTAFNVTVDGTSASPSLCADFSTGGAGGALDGAMTLTMGATAELDCYGSMTLPATNFAFSGTTGALLVFAATTTGKTVTSNGVSFGVVQVNFNGVGGGWTLGSAFTNTTTLGLVNGTLNTSASNYSISTSSIFSSYNNVRSLVLNGSTVTASGTSINFSTSTNFTFNAGTSTITCSNASPTLSGGGLTFYNVTFSSAAGGTVTITGTNTFNNLTFTSRSATGIRVITFGANQTVSGTLTFGTANTAIRRILVQSDTVGTQRTITLNGTLATLADVDFRDTSAAGTVATPWTGTRLGNGSNNSNITTATPKTVYWNLAGSQSWSSTGWATTNNGAPAVNNFPLAQDTAVFTEAGSAGTVTVDAGWWIGSIQMADGVSNRTTAFTLATGTTTPTVYGNITFFSSLVLSGTGTITLAGQSAIQTITSAGITFTQPITINSPSGTVRVNGNLTLGSTLTTTFTAGTLDLTNNGAGNYTLSTGLFSSSNSNTRAITFGTGNITCTGTGTVWTTATITGLTVTGTPVVNVTSAGSTAITVSTGGLSEANSISFNFTGGTYALSFLANASYSAKNIDFTGFAGTWNATSTGIIYGNLKLSTGMTLTASANAMSFAATSGTQKITTNGKTIDFPLTFNGIGGTFQLQDNMTVGSTRTVTLTNGALDLTGNSGNWNLSTGLFASSNSNTRSIAFGSTGKITVTGNNGTVWSTANGTNFTYSGTSNVDFTYSGSTGTRTVAQAPLSLGGGIATALNMTFSAGSDTITFGGSGRIYANTDFTGFSGTYTNTIVSILGNLTFSTGMTVGSGSQTVSFTATSGTQTITTNGKTLDFPLQFSGNGGTVSFADALTMGSSQFFIIADGSTVKLKAGTTNTVSGFMTSGTLQKYLQSTLAGTQATITQASGEVTVTYLSVKDSNATGGVVWNASDTTNVDAGNNTGWLFATSGNFFFMFN